jgi:uncharacterized protein (TIGR00297 family)
MPEEMLGKQWRKAIPQQRDRLQSRVLVGVVGVVLAALILSQMYRVYILAARFPAVVAWGVGISLGFALLVKTLRAATTGGAVCGGMTCWLVMLWTGTYTETVMRSGLTPLILLFALTFAATRMGRAKKARAGLAESRRGRSAAQVIANLSVAALCGPLFGMALIGWSYWRSSGMTGPWIVATIRTICLASLVEATADTVSSEIGQAFGGRPVMLTTLRRVAAGTDGAVTLLGSAAGIAAGALVAGAGGWAMHLDPRATVIALGAGVVGLFFDSLLGATVERRGWMGNDLVNFSSTAFAAVLAFGCRCLMFRYLMF